VLTCGFCGEETERLIGFVMAPFFLVSEVAHGRFGPPEREGCLLCVSYWSKNPGEGDDPGCDCKPTVH